MTRPDRRTALKLGAAGLCGLMGSTARAEPVPDDVDFVRDVPEAELHLLDGSHFLLETHGPVAARRVGAFLSRYAV